jgi:hypothetical protein
MNCTPLRVRSLVVASALLFVPALVSAQVMTFTSTGCATGGTVDAGSSYSEAGFNLSSTDLVGWCADLSHYPGSAALFINNPGEIATLTKTGGGTFAFTSIDLAHVYSSAMPSQLFTFTGHVFGGGDVTQTFTIAAQGNVSPTFSTYFLDGSFTNLTSVDFATQEPNYYQFDNVTMNAEVAPEPASLILLGSGLAGVFAVVRRRRR